jgi:hypothetical protein
MSLTARAEFQLSDNSLRTFETPLHFPYLSAHAHAYRYFLCAFSAAVVAGLNLGGARC